jgi:hypothetical protein
LTASAASYSAAEAAGVATLQPASAVASSVAGAAASANPIADFISLLLFPFQYVLAQVNNLIGYLLYTFFIGPIINPVIDAIITAIIQAIAQSFVSATV